MTRFHTILGVFIVLSALAAALVAMPGTVTAQDRTYAIDTVAVTGEPAPGTGGLNFEWFSTYNVDLSDSGVVAFVGSPQPLPSGNYDQAIWVGSPGNLALALRTGDPTPGGTAETFFQFFEAFVNGPGDLSVHASFKVDGQLSGEGILQYRQFEGVISGCVAVSDYGFTVHLTLDSGTFD